MAAEEEKTPCGNCGKPVEKALRCSICRKATYCSAACQKEEWKFHKRICKKWEPPEEPKKAGLENQSPEEVAEMKKQMEEMMKDKDPGTAHQVNKMMCGMMGVEPPAEPPKPAEPPPNCTSCAKACTKVLRCGKCKTAPYCSAACQKEDWRFHKRICKPPGAPAGPPAGPPATGPEGQPAATEEAGRMDYTDSAKAEDFAPPARPKAENEKVVEGEDVGKWYKHRDWKPGEAGQECAPQKMEQAAAAAAAGKEAAGSSQGSAWNKAGTWEEKSMVPWWQKKVQDLKGLTAGEDGFLQIDAVSELQGSASIVRVRGQPKFMYDLKFNMPFTGLRRCKCCARSPGSRCSNCVRFAGRLEVVDFSWDCNDDDIEFQVKHSVPAGPDHVKKADSSECRKEAEAQLQPLVKAFLAEAVADYKGTVEGAAEAQKWASQLPPASQPPPTAAA